MRRLNWKTKPLNAIIGILIMPFLCLSINTVKASEIHWGTGSGDTYNPATVVVDHDISLVATSQYTIEVTAPDQTYVFNNTNQGVGITATSLNPTTFTIRYGLTAGNYNLTSAPQARYVSDSKTVYYQVTGTGHETKTGSYQLTITGKTIQYSVGAYTDATSPSAVQNTDHIVLPSTNPTATGYNFMGWSTSPTENVCQTADTNKQGVCSGDGSEHITDDTVLYAVWDGAETVLTFDANLPDAWSTANIVWQSTGQPATTKTIQSGHEYGELPIASINGYEFVGWSKNQHENPTATEGTQYISDGELVTEFADVTVYAIWKARDINVYFKFLDTSSLWDVTPDGLINFNQIVTYGNPITMPATYDVTVQGYVFNGWASTNDMSSPTYSASYSKGGTYYLDKRPNNGWESVTNASPIVCDVGTIGCSTTVYTYWTPDEIQVINKNLTIDYSYNYDAPFLISLEAQNGTGNYSWSINTTSTAITNYFEVSDNSGSFSIDVKANSGRYSIPAGTYTIPVKVVDTSASTKTGSEVSATGTVTITVNKLKVTKPTALINQFTYDGSTKYLIDSLGLYSDPSNPYIQSTNNSAVNVGDYTATYTLRSPENTVWADNSTAPVNLSWSIKKVLNLIRLSPATATIRYPETIDVEVAVDYGTYSFTANDNLTITKTASGVHIVPLKSGDYQISFTSEADNTDSDTAILYLTVLPGNIEVNPLNTYTYDGQPHAFQLNENPTDANKQYKVANTGTYSDTVPTYTNAGSYDVWYKLTKESYATLEGKAVMTINPKLIDNVSLVCDPSNCHAGAINEYDYDENGFEPEVIVTANLAGVQTTLVEGRDYDVTYSGAMVGDTSVVIVGKGNFTGTIVQDYRIGAGNITYRIIADKFIDNNGNVFESEYSGWFDSTVGNAGSSVFTYRSEGYNGNVQFDISPTSAVIKYGTTEGVYDYKQMPTFKNAGTYTVYFQITQPGYETVQNSINIVIDPLELDWPTAMPVCSTGAERAPEWINYNPLYMAIGNETSGKDEGVYVATFDLFDKQNTAWKNVNEKDKHLPIEVEWRITGECTEDDEEIVEIEAEYGKYCTLEWVGAEPSTKIKAFTKPGMVQVGWVERREDTTKLYDVGADVINLESEEGAKHDLYAIWQTSTYKVSIDYDGGAIQGKDYIILLDGGEQSTSFEIRNNPSVVSYNQYFAMATPTKPGYMFMGWSIWNMDESEHIIGSHVGNETAYETIENYFMNLTSVADSTVYFKAMWKEREIFIDNNEQQMVAYPAAQWTKKMNRATNGSGSYVYDVISVSPSVRFSKDDGLDHSAPTYGFVFDTETMQMKVPGYVEPGDYVITLQVTDSFTKKTKPFYFNLTVVNPTVKLVNGTNTETYTFALNTTWAQWYSSAFNTSASAGSSITVDSFVKACTETNLFNKWTTDDDVKNYLGTAPTTDGWKAPENQLHNLNFDSQGGTAIPSRQLMDGDPYGYLPIPQKEGYRFLGWFNITDESCRIVPSDKAPQSDVNAYAHYYVGKKD